MIKVLFLDRDGVVNFKAPAHHYITDISEFKFKAGIFDFVKKFIKDGFKVIILTNQRGIARGMLSLNKLEKIHWHMRNEFFKKGIQLLDIFVCPHEEGVCECRKPKPGMLVMATNKYVIDIPNSVFVTDSMEEIIMAQNFGIGKSIYLNSEDIDYEKIQLV